MKKTISCLIFCLLSFNSFTQITWDALGAPRGVNVRQVKAGPNESIFILTLYSDFYRSFNGGTDWEQLELPEDFNVETWTIDANGHAYLKWFDTIIKIPFDQTTYSMLPILPAWGDHMDVTTDGSIIVGGNGIIQYLLPEESTWQTLLHDEDNLQVSGLAAGTGGVHYLMSSYWGNSKVYRFNLSTLLLEEIFAFAEFLANAAYHPTSGLWIVDIDSNLYNISDQGDSWQEIPTLPEAQFIGVDFGVDERIFLHNTVASPLHYTSTDNGQSWVNSTDLLAETIASPSITTLTDGTEIYYNKFCENYLLLKSSNQGASYDDLIPNLQHISTGLRQMTDAGAGRLIAKTCNLDLHWSLDDGESWSTIRTSDGLPIKLTQRALDGNLVAIGANNQIYRSLDEGDSWENITPAVGISGILYTVSIAALDMDRILVVSDNGNTYYTSNGGQDWSFEEVSQYSNQLVAHRSGIFISYSNNNSDFFRIYDANDETWVLRDLGLQTIGSLEAFASTDSQLLFYIKGDSLGVDSIYITEDYGLTFISYAVPEFIQFSSIQIKANSANDLFLLTDEVLYKSSTSGENWIVVDDDLPGGSVQSDFLFIDQEDYLYLSGQTDTIYRSSTPTAFANFISGHFWSDNNLDCNIQEDGESDLSGWIVKATSESGIYYSRTNTEGDYLLNAPLGDYQVEAVINNPLYDACNSVIPVTLSTEDTVRMIDFPLQPTTFCSLLRPLVSTPFMRRCFDNTFYISVNNEGNVTAENATLTITLDDFLVYQNSDFPILSQDGQNYTFALGDVLPGQSVQFSLSAYLSCDAELGQEHCVTLTTSPSNDCAPDYIPDTYQECQNNRGSYDPNDKRAFVNGKQITDYLLPDTERLTYHIRFQNTGTDTAFTVVVEDVLAPEMDITTFQLEGNSHPVRVNFPYDPVETATTVHFIFDDIMLVDSFTNEAASHGFIKFSIAPIEGLELGTTVNNYADIFFDFNDPIRTNTVSLVYDFSDSVNNLLDEKWQIKAYPNPFNNSIYLQVKEGLPLQTIYCDWFNAQGQCVDRQIMQNGYLVWERPDLPSGLYTYRLRSKSHFLTYGKVIKQDQF